jgi:hypothetical protein
MKTSTLLGFSLAFLFFFFAPAFLSSSFPLYPLMKNGDALDLLTPLVLIPLYWTLFSAASSIPVGRRGMLAFLVLASLWVLGQGMHLAGNSIGHQLQDFEGTSAYKLTYFYDEVLSHYLWHFGIFGLAALIMARSWDAPREAPAGLAGLVIAVILYGFAFACITLEGQTWPAGLPFALLAGLIPLVFRRSGLGERPALGFFTYAHLLAVVITVIWALIQGGFIEPSEVLGF